jgi:uncharacterized protein (DUF488 family)
MGSEIHTVGHSTHTSELFIQLLETHSVTAIADVRSTPYSRRNPQFDRNNIRAALKAKSIQYAFLGKELGARSDDECCYVNDKVSYSLLAKTPLFESGIDRVVEGARTHRIALMCAEKDPLDCHRTILVARRLIRSGYRIVHILGSGLVETHDDALTRLMNRLKLSAEDMFRSPALTVEEAYEKQADLIAFDRSLRRAEASHRGPTFNERKSQ